MSFHHCSPTMIKYDIPGIFVLNFLLPYRLKELLRAKLIECGWRDQLKAHCKGKNRLIVAFKVCYLCLEQFKAETELLKRYQRQYHM